MSTKRGLDWKAGHGPGWAAINGAGVSAVVAAGGYLAHMPPALGLAEGAAGAAAAVIVGARRKVTGGNLAYRAAAWLTAGGWTSWAIVANPWTWGPMGALVGGSLLAWGANAAYAEYEVNETGRRRVRLLQKRRDEIAADWEDRLARVARIQGCTVVGVQDWPAETGYTLQVNLPSGGTTWQELQRHQDGLAADMRLPQGCGIEVVSGRDRGTAILRVGLVNVMEKLLPLPADLSPTTINDPFGIGLHRDGTDALISLRFNCGLLTGQTDAGKTNTLNVINRGLLRTVDTLVWHIDTTGAGISLPWLRAWALDGASERPAIDWTAPNNDEAMAMTSMAIEIIAARKTGYQDLMHSVNDDKVPVSHQLPEIVIVADEVAELPLRVQQQIDSIINTGRAAGVRVLNCALRATQDTISAAMKKQTRVRIGMRATDPEEYSHLFAGYQMVDPADAPYAGSGFLAAETITPRPFKSFRIEPNQITAIAAEVAARRPSLDALSAGVKTGPVYATRWARTLPQLYPNSRLAPAAAALASGAPVPVASGSAFVVNLAPGGTAQAAAPATANPNFDKAAFDAKFAVPGAPAPQADADQDDQDDRDQAAAARQFQSVLDAATLTPATYEPIEMTPLPTLEVPPAVPLPARDRALVLLQQAGPAGIGATRLAELLTEEGHGTQRPTAQNWLSRWAAEGLAVRHEDGRYPVYVHADHIAARDVA